MKILYLYLNPIKLTYQKILAGELPSNHLYGYIELEKLGYDVSHKDSQPRGPLRKLTNFLNKRLGIYLKDFKTLYNFRNYDVIVIKGPFSTQVTIACRLLNKKLVYLDPILRLPRSYIRRFFLKINLELADGSIVFSRTQFNLIQQVFNVNDTKLKLIPFSLDTNFFKPAVSANQYEKPFILSVGMDLGRDYATLIESMKGLDIDLKIVTLPYLLKGLDFNKPNIQILSHLSYKELFELYAESLFVVIPIKKWATQYSSGTTSLLEAKLLDKAVIATASKPLEEYLENTNGVIYVEPENVPDIRQAISKLIEQQEFRASMQNKGAEIIRTRYNTYVFAQNFGIYLQDLVSNDQTGSR